jgi:hypothetical protein
MTKPLTLEGYGEQVTRNCERVLVTLLCNLGPHKNSLVLIGGLTPRCLVPERPPVVPQHAGRFDLDVVIDLVVLDDIEAYRTLKITSRKSALNVEKTTKILSVNSDDLGSRWQSAPIERLKLGEDIFQDASDQVMDCFRCVLGESWAVDPCPTAVCGSRLSS